MKIKTKEENKRLGLRTKDFTVVMLIISVLMIWLLRSVRFLLVQDKKIGVEIKKERKQENLSHLLRMKESVSDKKVFSVAIFCFWSRVDRWYISLKETHVHLSSVPNQWMNHCKTEISYQFGKLHWSKSRTIQAKVSEELQ